MNYDIIIIGSGLGGLECATMLSKQGRSVLVLERQTQPGGCMQSYKRGNATFDTGLHYIGGIDEGQPLHDTFKSLGLLDLPWHRLDSDGFDRITIGNETFAFREGYANFAQALAERFPSQRQALQDYVDMLRRSDDDQLATLNTPAATEDSFSNESFNTNAYAWLHEKFSDELLINVLSGASLKMELHKTTLPLFTFAHGNGSFIQSSWRLKGDGNMLVQKLVEQIKSNGGEVVCNAEVTELEEHDGRITAAICSNGERYEGKTFISNLHPATTCQLVKEGSAMKKIYRRRMANLPNTFGMFTTSIRLKPDTLPYMNHNKFIYAKPNVWEMSEPDHEGYGILVSCPYSDTGYATTLDILTPMLWREVEQWQDTTIGHRGDDYKAMKQRKAEQVIRIAEQQIPGLIEAIDHIYTSTPLTYRDYNHTPNGSAYGIRKDCNNPMMTILTPRTPISNLLMTGQNLMLHGLHGVTMTALYTSKVINQMHA